jgi:hypothetical protein
MKYLQSRFRRRLALALAILLLLLLALLPWRLTSSHKPETEQNSSGSVFDGCTRSLVGKDLTVMKIKANMQCSSCHAGM